MVKMESDKQLYTEMAFMGTYFRLLAVFDEWDTPTHIVMIRK